MKSVISFVFCIASLSVILFTSINNVLSQNKENNNRKFTEYSLHYDGHMQELIYEDINNDNLMDIICIHTFNNSRMLSYYLQQNNGDFLYKPNGTVIFPKYGTAFSFSDVVNDKGKEILLYTPQSLMYYSFNDKEETFSKQPEILTKTETFFFISQADYIPFLFHSVDIDNNGIDDVIIPKTEGYELFMCQAKGILNNKIFIKIPIVNTLSEGKTIQRDIGLSYKSSIPFLFLKDLNKDSKIDLCYFSENVLYYHYQNKETCFTENPNGKIIMPLKPGEMISNKVKDVSYQLFDINNDGFYDIIITLTSGDVSDFQKIITKHYIFIAKGSMQYDKIPNHIIKQKGVIFAPSFFDINNDNCRDLSIARIETDIGTRLEEAILKSVNVYYEVFLFNKANNTFFDSPNYSYTLNISPKELRKRGTQLDFVSFNYDLTNDKISDMLLYSPSNKKNNIAIYKGILVQNNKFRLDFDKSPYYKGNIPKNPNKIYEFDLNSDKSGDVIFSYNKEQIIIWINSN